MPPMTFVVGETALSAHVDKRIDIAVALGLIVICAIFLFESRDLKPGTFEPLGSAPVPQATATLIILLCSVVIAKAARQPTGIVDSEPASYWHAVITVILTVVYVALIHLRLATFAVLTTAYLILTIGWLVQFKPRLLPAVAVTSLVVGFGSQYVFTRVFIVDLPGL